MNRDEVSLGIYEKAFPDGMSMLDMFRIAKSEGYDFFELSVDRTEERILRLYDTSFQQDLEDAILKGGFTVGTVVLSALSTYTLGHPDTKIRERGMDIFHHAIDFASRFGIRIVQIPACDVPKFDTCTDESNHQFLNNLLHLVEYAAKQGVHVGLENMENDYMDTIQKCMAAIHFVNSPYFQLYSDVGNITNALKNDIYEILHDMQSGAGHLLSLHLKEVRPGKYGGLFYEGTDRGIVKFPQIVAHSLSLGVRRFAMEYWYGGVNWRQDLETATKFFSEWISH